MNMEKVRVVTSGYQKGSDGSMEMVNHQAEGQYYFRNGKHYYKYNDRGVDKSSEISTTLKTDGREFFIFRHGAVDTEMRFAVGTKTRTVYRTAFSVMEMEIDTKRLLLNINGALVGEYKLQIKITRAEG